VVGAGNVAGAAGARADAGCGLDHGADHLRVSSLVLARDQPLGGVRSLVEKTKLLFLFMPAMISRAKGGGGTRCGLLFFVLSLGGCHVPSSRNSSQRMVPTSSSLWPSNSNRRMT